MRDTWTVDTAECAVAGSAVAKLDSGINVRNASARLNKLPENGQNEGARLKAARTSTSATSTAPSESWPLQTQKTGTGKFAYVTGLFCFFEFFDQRGDYLEEVAYYAVIGYFEDGGVLIFVNGGDGAGAFHAYHVLDCAADA
jgi:hypothetical protein